MAQWEPPTLQIQKYVRGVIYPTRREVVVEAAQRNGAPPEVIERLNNLLPRVSGPHEVQIALRRAPEHEQSVGPAGQPVGGGSSYLSHRRYRSGPGLGEPVEQR
jgi:hypothetical protein